MVTVHRAGRRTGVRELPSGHVCLARARCRKYIVYAPVSPVPGAPTSAKRGVRVPRSAGGPSRRPLGRSGCLLVLPRPEGTPTMDRRLNVTAAEQDPGSALDVPCGGSDHDGIVILLTLPRDRMSVPVARHLVHDALCDIGTHPDDVADIELALSEACTNVLDHSGPVQHYAVTVTIGLTGCRLQVVDDGRGFDHDVAIRDKQGLDAERGRGLTLMRAIMDRVQLESAPDRGTEVTLIKALSFDDDAPAHTLLDRGPVDEAETAAERPTASPGRRAHLDAAHPDAVPIRTPGPPA